MPERQYSLVQILILNQMSRQSTGSLLFSALKALLIAIVKFSCMILSWALQITSLLCGKLSEAIEKIILKRL